MNSNYINNLLICQILIKNLTYQLFKLSSNLSIILLIVL
ncbi:hypothetical protein RBEAN4_0648 [Rickettsia bellii str. RML An4]|uniref:Uncharacterized protein n=1 Tax=Rickettsia bellii str. RML An4 TaxID=1359193 RepID=A0A0F3QBP4_RICBE|nr:hypothetical protein RBEAN4_0648 [Rickettsia bellii str. RML An4]